MKQVIHAELYRLLDGKIEFLLIKRVSSDGGFWQPITGGIEEGEDTITALVREVAEETGVQNLLHVSEELHRTYWDYKGGVGYDLVHAVHVPADVEVTLNPAEHEAYLWLPLEEALEQLFYDGNKQAMRVVHRYIQQRHIAT